MGIVSRQGTYNSALAQVSPLMTPPTHTKKKKKASLAFKVPGAGLLTSVSQALRRRIILHLRGLGYQRALLVLELLYRDEQDSRSPQAGTVFVRVAYKL